MGEQRRVADFAACIHHRHARGETVCQRGVQGGPADRRHHLSRPRGTGAFDADSYGR